MTRFILRAKVVSEAPDYSVRLTGFALRGGYPQNAAQMAGFTNAVQERLERGRLGIPALFKDNARNHVESNPMFGIAAGAGAFTEFPKEAGLAAAALGAGAPVDYRGTIPADLKGDMSVLRDFSRVMGREWRAIGLRGMYGYMADLGTEPRWARFHETFTEDADRMSDIIGTLVEGLQGPVRKDGTSLSPKSSVALTIKHFPGGGPQEMGWDPHYTFGKPSPAEAPDGCLDSNLIFGGAFPWEVSLLALSDLAKAESWTMTPALPEIQAAMREIGDPARVIVSIYFRNPYVLDAESGVSNAGALLAAFGVSDRALLDIITGKAAPAGRLPFALPASRTALLRQHPDAPGYDAEGTLYPFGFGLGFSAQGKQAAE